MCVLRVFLLAAIICQSQSALTKNLESFTVHELVPDILSQTPSSLLTVKFPSGVEVSEGNELAMEEVQGFPVLSWDAEDGAFYTVVMCDADAPSRADPNARSVLHWLVINVQLDDVTTGDTLADLLYSNPGPGTGLHRYVILVYRQPAQMTIEDDKLNATFEGRVNFSLDELAAKYNLGDPIAGNFYQTQNF